MDYEKKYKEALKKARIWKDKSGMPKDKQGILDDIFPELKESEDDRIKKALIAYCKVNMGLTWHSIKQEEYIAWLEKQGEQKPQGKSALEAAKEEKVDNQNCVKPADKVEPKFKVGDWVICCDYEPVQIIGIRTNVYDMSNGDIRPFYMVDDNDNIRLWTIQDAKDGDVLVSKSTCGLGTWYCIFKSLDDDESMTVYCYLARNGRFETKKELCFDKDPYNTIPATKEQRDTLLKAMADAGYTFDFEKKELKKMEQKPTWSEEDENRFNNLIFLVECSEEGEATKQGFIKFINKLKSLKPQNTWKPSDEQMDALESAIVDSISSIQKHSLESLYNELKKLF